MCPENCVETKPFHSDWCPLCLGATSDDFYRAFEDRITLALEEISPEELRAIEAEFRQEFIACGA